MRNSLIFIAILTLFSFGCGGNSSTPVTPKDSVSDETTTKDAGDLPMKEGVHQEGITEGLHEGINDPGPKDTGPKQGKLGWPCNDNADCESGFCVESRNGKVCTEFCTDSCPAGWACKGVVLSGDETFLCLPRFLTLCDPCNKPEDCNPTMSAGGAGCIDMNGEGSFCGGDCSVSDCPEGFECKDVALPEGVKKQCVPKSGKCKCGKRAISLQLSTTCYIQNDKGKCMGTRTCTQTGLTDCDARTPKAEECNKIDDDCNGKTDDGLDQVPCTNHNNYGTCQGTGKCVDGQIVECNAPAPAPEKCDGFDNDCDGSTDEDTCYDGDPCTEDKCDPGSGGCIHPPLSGVKCDDGNICTTGDHCENGKCVAGVKKNCDDSNPCTDDSCDPSDGHCIHTNNTAPCDDKNPCTVDDHCVNGQCQAGSPKQCPDNPPCKVNGKCNPQTGACVYTLNDGMSCDDDDPCTVSTTCTGGVCGGGHDYCQGKVCTPGSGQNFCMQPQCVNAFGIATCPCVCF